MTSGQIAYRLTAEQYAELAARAAASSSTPTAQAKGDLLVLHHLLAAELRRFPLTRGEADVLLEIDNGAFFGTSLGRVLHAQAADAFTIAREADPTGGEACSYADQHGIDEAHLLRRLGAMSPCADLAVREALARWWSDEDRGEGSYAAAGLHIRGAGSQTS